MRALAASLLLATSIVSASTYAPRTDQQVVALDLATGAVKWTFDGAAIGNAHFELYPQLLVAYPHYDNQDKSAPIFLDPATGAVVKDSRDPKQLVGASSAQWLHDPIVLASGWRLENFRAGNDRTLAFTDPKTSKVAWTIDPGNYAERVLAYKDMVLVAYGYLTHQALLFGYKPGSAKPAWTIDFNRALNKPDDKHSEDRLGRVQPQIIGDVLYAQTGPYIYAIAPTTGKILWSIDAAKATKLAYRPELYGGALDVAVFARDGDTLVVSYEKRVLALNAKTGALRWHFAPDTFPHAAFPIARAGIVYLTSGKKRSAVAKP